MDSRRKFLRGIAQAAAGAGRERPSRGDDDRAPTVPPRPTGAETAPAEPGSRYARPLASPGWGPDAQRAVEGASVLVIGAGALAAPVAYYLTAAGIGRVGIADEGAVELAELHAQHLHFTPDVGMPRAHSAAVKLAFLNPEVVVEPYEAPLDPGNADAMLAGHDLIVDCAQSPEIRRLAGETCWRSGIPLVAADAAGPRGAVWVAVPGATPCLACSEATSRGLGAEAPAWPAGPLAGVVGSLQAHVALELLAGAGAGGEAHALLVSLDPPAIDRVPVAARPDCPLCAGR